MPPALGRGRVGRDCGPEREQEPDWSANENLEFAETDQWYKRGEKTEALREGFGRSSQDSIKPARYQLRQKVCSRGLGIANELLEAFEQLIVGREIARRRSGF